MRPSGGAVEAGFHAKSSQNKKSTPTGLNLKWRLPRRLFFPYAALNSAAYGKKNKVEPAGVEVWH